MSARPRTVVHAVVTTLLVAVLGAAGCDRPENAPPTPPLPSAAASPSAARHEPPPEPYAEEPLPDEDDFAAEAEREIPADRYRDKLDELEREITAATRLADEAAAKVLAAEASDDITKTRATEASDAITKAPASSAPTVAPDPSAPAP